MSLHKNIDANLSLTVVSGGVAVSIAVPSVSLSEGNKNIHAYLSQFVINVL